MLEIKNFVSPDQLLFELEPGSYQEIMEQMVTPLVKSGVVTDRDQFLADLLARESHLSTVTESPCVGFPHALSQSATRLGLSIAIPKSKEIYLPGYDTPVQAFFMIASPRFIPTLHLTMLEILNSFVKDEVKFPKFIKQRTEGLTARMLSAYKLKK
ncbi:MAG: PTS sugar transporter subunit IIA [Lentisphaeria bacterium]|nr:PTS sugar transporter subunit IIA [Lentisphaeria bacterium]